jgi:hypothetical protein
MGYVQSGLLEGKVVNPDYHWEMLPAATKIGRSFLEGRKLDMNHASESPSNNILMEKLRDGALDPFYDSTNASIKNGFTLRLMMALFGDRKTNTIDAIVTLQKLCEVKGQVSANDKLVNQKILSSLQSISFDCNEVTMFNPVLKMNDEDTIDLSSSNKNTYRTQPQVSKDERPPKPQESPPKPQVEISSALHELTHLRTKPHLMVPLVSRVVFIVESMRTKYIIFRLKSFESLYQPNEWTWREIMSRFSY